MASAGGRGVRVVIGLVAIVGACVAAYFSASPSIRCVRAAAGADCTVTAKAFNLMTVDEAQVAGVRSVVMIASATGRSRTPPHLFFRTDAGDVHLGSFSQRFSRQAAELDAFVRESTAPEIRFDTGVTFRNVTAYAATAFLLL